MERFFRKKFIFAALFLVLLLGFCVLNGISEAPVLGDLAQDLLQVRSLEELEEWISDVEDDVSDEILGHRFWIETYSWIQEALGKREFDSFSVIKDETGMLYYGSTYQAYTDDLETYAAQTLRLKEMLDRKGIRLMVVLPPSKVLYGVTEVDLDWPINDPNARMDKLLMQLQQRGVTAVDLRPVMQHSGQPLEKLFFKTDHHWTPRAAFYGMREIVGRLEQEFGIVLDPDGYYRDLSNYEIQDMGKIMLGSNGRNVGIPYSGLDNFEYIWLREYEGTEYSWIDYEDEEEQTGNLKQTLLREKWLQVEDFYKMDPYWVYLDSLKKMDSVVNHSNPDGLQIAVLRDSYFSPVACFLAPMVGRMDMFWNQDRDAVSSFMESVEQGDYDLVIVEIYPYNLGASAFAFFEEAAS